MLIENYVLYNTSDVQIPYSGTFPHIGNFVGQLLKFPLSK